jgi:WD40 repeat protein/tRNA A-37 threonylcarbamoyl transferase component Bud32
MISEKKCGTCGTPLSESALQGLCRKCLASAAFGGTIGFNPAQPGEMSRSYLFGDYELLNEIARGGMGVVYKARQISLNRIVALKMVLHGPFSSAEFIQRFRTEAEAAAGLQHPNIVAIYEVGRHDGYHYFSMEYIEGCDLSELVREHPLPARRAAAYVKTVAEALEYAHQKGVLHRDLKPSNLLLDIFDEPRITDFGLARLVKQESHLTVTGQALGSPGFMAPEQAAGKMNDSSPLNDIYSLGAILYNLITGRPPFQGETLPDILLQLQNNDPIPPRHLNPNVPLPLQNICLKCLQKDPAKRYASARALADDLGRFLVNEPIHARPATTLEKIQLYGRRHPVPAALSVALFIAVLIGLIGVLWQWRRAETYGREMSVDLYAADINLAAHAIAQGDYGLGRRTLAGLKPKPGREDLRGFEWRYLWNLSRGDQSATLTGHAWTITCAAYSPDGKLLASGSQDGSVKIWDAQRRQLITTLPGSGAIWSVAFSPDGTQLIKSGNGRKVDICDTHDWHIVKTLDGEITALSKISPLLAVAHSSPFFWEEAGGIELWNYHDGKKLRDFPQPGRALALSPDDQTLAIAGPSQNITLWSTANGALLRTLETEHPVWSMAFSPVNQQFASAGWASEALVWDLAGTNAPVKLTGHAGNVWSVVYSPNGSNIVTTGSDQTVRFWDAATFQPKNILRGHGNEVWCAAFSPDGKTLATGGKDQTVRLWATSRSAVRDRVPNRDKTQPWFSPDGSRLATLDPVGDELRSHLWNVADRTPGIELPPENVTGFSADGNQVVSWEDSQSALKFWSLPGRSATFVKLEGVQPSLDFEKSGFSPGGETFFAIDDNGRARLWETANGKLIASLAVPRPPIRSASLGPNGHRLAISLEREDIARIYETKTGREIDLAGHRDFIVGMDFSPDEEQVATASVDGTIKLWDAATGREIATLPGHRSEATDVAFSPDGRTLASIGTGQSVKLWHVATRRELLAIDFPEAGLFLQFSPDGRHLAYTADDNTVRFLDAPTLDELNLYNP